MTPATYNCMINISFTRRDRFCENYDLSNSPHAVAKTESGPNKTTSSYIHAPHDIYAKENICLISHTCIIRRGQIFISYIVNPSSPLDPPQLRIALESLCIPTIKTYTGNARYANCLYTYTEFQVR
jgi:hypothetical protein